MTSVLPAIGLISTLDPVRRATDPTGLSSPIGRVVILAGLIAALVVLILNFHRRR